MLWFELFLGLVGIGWDWLGLVGIGWDWPASTLHVRTAVRCPITCHAMTARHRAVACVTQATKPTDPWDFKSLISSS